MTVEDALTEALVRIDSYLAGSSLESMAQDVREGLTREPKEIPPKYFYDDRGSDLFERITKLPEYYPARCERAILHRRAPEIAALTGAEELVELGSGSASKTRALLSAMADRGTLRRYVPVDVARTAVERSALELAELYPGLRVHAVVGDFERHLAYVPQGEARLFAFLGGTIGNLAPQERACFLSDLRGVLGGGDRLLLGSDFEKDVGRLEAAYNDSRGLTAEFNRNVLHVINRELGGDFRPEAFDHVAFYDQESRWVEMRLRARGAQRVLIQRAGLEVGLADGEAIRTEISAKFTPAGIEGELRDAGLRLERFFTDEEGLFGVSLAAPA
ncbi:MAG: L-histidine N(alpha)-methyltransferase [Actinomycetota bacterium]|nr:L-histidine N(alpha)-methyltransferase [Actinomycetota bacterium]